MPTTDEVLAVCLDILTFVFGGPIVYGVGVIVGLFIIAKKFKFWSRLKQFIATIDALADLPEMKGMVDKIHHEVIPNHGSSLNDSVRRTEYNVYIQSLEQAKQAADLAILTEQFNNHLKHSKEQDEKLQDIHDTLR